MYNSYTARGRELDRTSIAAYLEQIVPGGLKSRLGQLLDVAYNIEFGAETNEQSSLNLLYLLGYSAKDELRSSANQMNAVIFAGATTNWSAASPHS